MPTHSFKFRIGEVTVEAGTIILQTDEGHRHVWPYDFRRTPKLSELNKSDTADLVRAGKLSEKLLATVIPQVIAHGAQYLAHPVVIDWIEHNQSAISLLRLAGEKFTAERILRAEENLKAISLALISSAKRQHKNRDATFSSSLDDLTRAAKPIHDVWWNLRKLHRNPDQLRLAVIAEFVPESCYTEYDQSVRAEIGHWLRDFGSKSLTERKRKDVHLVQAIEKRLRHSTRLDSLAKEGKLGATIRRARHRSRLLLK